MLWLKFPETRQASEPGDITVELVSPEPAAEPAALRWRHSTTEVTFRGKEPVKGGNGRRNAGADEFLNLRGSQQGLKGRLSWYQPHSVCGAGSTVNVGALCSFV